MATAAKGVRGVGATVILLTVSPGPRSWELDVRCAYNEAASAQFKAIPGIRWDLTDRVRRGPAEAVRIACRELERAGIGRVREAGEPHTFTEFPPIDMGVLRTYQRDGARWLAATVRDTGGALLADEMGIGKSAQAIAACDALGDVPTLIVCPAIVVPHWKGQLQRFGLPERWWRAMSYDAFRMAWRKDPRALSSFKRAVIDEMHYLSNSRSQRSTAIAAWRHAAGPQLIGLTGTPMTARPSDLWHPLDVLHPGRWGSWFTFTKRYCGGRYEEIPNMPERAPVWVADGVSRPLELAERLRAVMLRRTKAEVALELPARTRNMLEVSLPAKARRDLARAQAALDWRGRKAESVQALLSNVEAYKVDAAVELTQEIAASGGRPLLLTTRKETARDLGKRLPGSVVVDGDTDAADRGAMLADARIGIATMYSVTTGIDLVGYDSVIFCGLDWLPSTLLQAEARVHRIGQTRAVAVWYLVGQGTLDEVVRERVIDRLDTFEEIGGRSSDGLAQDLRGGSDEELLASLCANIVKGCAA